MKVLLNIYIMKALHMLASSENKKVIFSLLNRSSFNAQGMFKLCMKSNAKSTMKPPFTLKVIFILFMTI
jgi:hypothetical protein